MQHQISIKENNRSWQRFIVMLRAYYVLNGELHQRKEGLVIDISRLGLCVKFHQDEKVTVGNSIYLEIFTKKMATITAKGTVTWTRKSANALIGGVKFLKMLDNSTFNDLG